MKSSLTLTPQEFTTIYNLQCQLHSISQRLEHVIHPSVHAELVDVRNKILTIIEPTLEKEDEDFDKNLEEFTKIQQENNLFANWSYYEISPSDINKKHSFKNIKSISYEGITIPFNKENKPKTWLDLWKVSDQIIRQSGDTHHCFLEDWRFQDGNLDVITGS
jgi:hypothetical protein